MLNYVNSRRKNYNITTFLLMIIMHSTGTGLPVVLKFLKFHSCPEIVLKSAIVLKFYSFGQNVLIWTSVMLSYTF